MQCPSATDLIIGSSYRDRYLMNTVSRTHDYMLEHLKEKLINERLARHRISPNLVQRLFTAAIWSAGTSVLASQTDWICGKIAVWYLHKRAAGGMNRLRSSPVYTIGSLHEAYARTLDVVCFNAIYPQLIRIFHIDQVNVTVVGGVSRLVTPSRTTQLIPLLEATIGGSS